MPLADTLSQWMGRVELVLAGADGEFKDGSIALAQGDALRARSLAHTVLRRVPGSPLGLALLADACELGGLSAELAMTLEELATKVSARADIWVRVARVRKDVNEDLEGAREAFLRALTVAEPGTDARREALCALADLDLREGHAARAELWLERIVGGTPRPEVALRRAEAKLALGDSEAAVRALADVPDDATDGRRALAQGRAFAALGKSEAFAPLLRAYILEVAGASEALSSATGWIEHDEETRTRIRTVVEARGELGLLRWRAALARAEGRKEEARQVLFEAAKTGERSAALPLFDLAIQDADRDALEAALEHLADADDPRVVSARTILLATANDAEPTAILDALHTITHEALVAWSERLTDDTIQRWIPEGGAPSAWTAVLARTQAHARSLQDLDATAATAALAELRTQPLRLAIVGEFNAGKSTFINALLGSDVAPTGVLPTTATLHHLRYAQDPIARICFHAPEGGAPAAADRLLPLSEVRGALKAIDPGEVRRVELCAPLVALTRVEIIDTPGFNAPDPRHAKAARDAFEEADLVVWLLDAAQAFKQSERAVLEELSHLGMPVQFFVNKADRLNDEERGRVLGLVEKSIEELGMTPLGPPLPLSAKLALAGKLGDANALERSNWSAVEALLEAEVVARSEELKERALRRRAGRLVQRLAAAASLAETRATAEREGRRSKVRSRLALAARLDRDSRQEMEKLSGALQKVHSTWLEDVELLATGRDGGRRRDPAIRRYREESALARLTDPLTLALLRIVEADGASLPDDEALRAVARALVRSHASLESDDETPIELARVAVLELAAWLAQPAAKRVGDPTETTRAAEAGRARELHALSDALLPVRGVP